MTTTKELADFAAEVDYEKLEDKTIEEIKKRILDTVGIGINALGEDSVDNVLATVRESGGNSQARLWGTSEHTNLESAAMYNTCLTRYLDFMDSFLAPGETPHPSDNIASIIAVSEYKNSSGKDLIENIGVAYELQGELAWNAPVRDRGWDHVTHTILSQATATGRALGLEGEELQNAIGIAGTSHNSLRVTRTGGINEWKGLVVGNSARNAVYSAKLANNGVEGPKNLFEGQKGWEQIVSGEFEVDLSLGCERVFDTMTKRYVAETYAQSAVEGIIDAAEENDLDARNVESIELTTFHGAKLIIGGG
jgi:2-methylcitrate dehydratase